MEKVKCHLVGICRTNTTINLNPGIHALQKKKERKKEINTSML
jgi:hypothetical protein